MNENTTTPKPGNLYRRPRPNKIIAGGKFYLANKKGSYGANTSPVHLALCREYLCVNDTLSIPLSSITSIGLAKHGGRIDFGDSIAGVHVEFNFTRLGSLRFKRKNVESFLDRLQMCLPERLPNSVVDSELSIESEKKVNCEMCGSGEVGVFIFHVLRFVGIVPIAYSYSLTPYRCVLCCKQARNQAIRCSLRTAVAGYLGFSGFLAAPRYVCKNLWTLRRAGWADAKTSILCILSSVILPYALIATVIILLIQ